MSSEIPFTSKRKAGFTVLLASMMVLSLASVVQTSGKAYAQSEESTITARIGFATFSYGLLSVSITVENVTPGLDTINIKYYNPDGDLLGEDDVEFQSIDSGTGSFHCYCFGVQREYVEDNYSIVVAYGEKTETFLVPPYSSHFPQPPDISVEQLRIYSDGLVSTSGRVWGGIGGENLTISVLPVGSDQLLGSDVSRLGLHVQFDGTVDTSNQLQVGSDYRIVYHLEGTDITEEKAFTFTGTDQALLKVATTINYGSPDYMPIEAQVILYDQDGNELQRDFSRSELQGSDLSPAEFLLTIGEQYLVEPTDSGEYVFDSWIDTGSTERVRSISITHGTYLNAGYRNAGAPAEPDFSISIDPASVELPARDSESASATVTITSLNGFNSEVTLETPGYQATIDDTSVTPPPDDTVTTTMSVQSSTFDRPGTYHVSLTAKSGTIFHHASLEVTVTETTTSGSQSELTVRTEDGHTGSEIFGYWTVLSKDGSAIETGFSPATFTLDSDENYIVSVADYGQYVFDHWQDSGSTTRDRLISISSDTSINAAYRNVNSPPLEQPPDEEPPVTPAEDSTVTIRSIDRNSGSEITGYYMTLFDSGGSVVETGFTPATFDLTDGQTYTVQVQDYGSYYFNYWQDNSDTDRDRTFTATDSAQTLTAAYGTSPSDADPAPPDNEEEQPPQQITGTISVTTVDSSGNQITGYYTTLSLDGDVVQTAFSPAEFTVDGGQIYQVAVGDYGQYVFDHWSDGSTGRFHDAEAGDDLEAVYRP